MPPRNLPLRRRRRRPRRVGLLVAVLALLGSCASESPEDPLPRSALLITLDTTRSDALGCYGNPSVNTPHLDRLAAEGLTYDRAHTPVPVTLPSHASMMTGLYPLRHTVRDNGIAPLPQGADTVAEAARAAGHQTAAILAAVVLADTFGLNQGFDVYETPRRPDRGVTSLFAERSAREVVDAALAWWAGRDPGTPFFLWVHFFDPHAPYQPPPGFGQGGANMSAYLGEVAAMDHEIGRLIDHLRGDGALDDATVMVVGDHGEAFGEHGTKSHAAYCYQEAMLVPFIVRYADSHRAGERSDEIVSVVDVCPTLCEAMGIRAPLDIDGTSLFRRSVPADRGVYVESLVGYLSYGWSPLVGWVDRHGKYLHSSSPEFFDLDSDPGETVNVVTERQEDVRRYSRAIEDLADRDVIQHSTTDEMDAQLLEMIRGLGYAGMDDNLASIPRPLERTELPSPAGMTRVHELLLEGSSLFNAERYEEAEALYTTALAENPDNLRALYFVATCRMRLGRYAEAIDPLERLIRLGRKRASTFFNLGVCRARTGDDGKAVEAFEYARELAPNDVRILIQLVRLLPLVGREEEAAEHAATLRRLGH